MGCAVGKGGRTPTAPSPVHDPAEEVDLVGDPQPPKLIVTPPRELREDEAVAGQISRDTQAQRAAESLLNRGKTGSLMVEEDDLKTPPAKTRPPMLQRTTTQSSGLMVPTRKNLDVPSSTERHAKYPHASGESMKVGHWRRETENPSTPSTAPVSPSLDLAS